MTNEHFLVFFITYTFISTSANRFQPAGIPFSASGPEILQKGTISLI